MNPTDRITRFLRRFDRLDQILVKAGFPPTSPWWRRRLERFLRTGRRRWVLRVGRRGGKSSTMCRIAVAIALFGDWRVSPGDPAVVAFLSTKKEEAAARLVMISKILDALRVGYTSSAFAVTLKDKPVEFRVITSTIKGGVGFTSIAIFADEMSRWESDDGAANPAKEIMASVRPTMLTQPNAIEVCYSSPWSTDDYHAQLFDEGDSAFQCADYAPTWVANPSPEATEQATHAAEPDLKIWQREYKAIPGATLSVALDKADVLACFTRGLRGYPTEPFVAIDASSLRGDDYAWIAGKLSTLGEIGVLKVGGFDANEQKVLSMSDIVGQIAAEAHAIGTTTVFGDQREEASLRSLFEQHGIAFVSYAWTEQSKDAAVMALRRVMREKGLYLVEHATLKKELKDMKARLQPSGRVKYETNGLDYASALITLFHALLSGAIWGGGGGVDWAAEYLRFQTAIGGGDGGGALPSGITGTTIGNL